MAPFLLGDGTIKRSAKPRSPASSRCQLSSSANGKSSSNPGASFLDKSPTKVVASANCVESRKPVSVASDADPCSGSRLPYGLIGNIVNVCDGPTWRKASPIPTKLQSGMPVIATPESRPRVSRWNQPFATAPSFGYRSYHHSVPPVLKVVANWGRHVFRAGAGICYRSRQTCRQFEVVLAHPASQIPAGRPRGRPSGCHEESRSQVRPDLAGLGADNRAHERSASPRDQALDRQVAHLARIGRPERPA